MTRVLIVDDHEPTRTWIRRLLEAEGFDVVAEASGGREALAAARRAAAAGAAVELAIVDVGLPDLDGFAVATALAAAAPAAGAMGTRTVLTSSRDTVDHARVVASGARGFLPKDQLCVAALLPLLHDEGVA
jgi:DNA-binding NarL/FixJ family response regulator